MRSGGGPAGRHKGKQAAQSLFGDTTGEVCPKMLILVMIAFYLSNLFRCVLKKYTIGNLRLVPSVIRNIFQGNTLFNFL